MNQLIDIPYSKLKENKRAYEILLLRDLHDNAYTDIAKELNVSAALVISNYYTVKIRQMRYYINHLAIINGHQNIDDFRKVYHHAHDCYQDPRYVTAYFEKEYGEILSEYRAGEPAIAEQFIQNLPPFKIKWSKNTISRVIEMREVERKSFAEIGKEIKATKSKAEHLYEWYYHQKWLTVCDKVRETYYGGQRSDDFKDHYKEYKTAKKRLENVIKDYPELFE